VGITEAHKFLVGNVLRRCHDLGRYGRSGKPFRLFNALGRVRKESKAFFFEKKKQKTFVAVADFSISAYLKR
jgi:hypothetical protein